MAISCQKMVSPFFWQLWWQEASADGAGNEKRNEMESVSGEIVWDVAVGGCNTTWFNGMVVLTVSIILLGIVLLCFQKKRKQG